MSCSGSSDPGCDFPESVSPGVAEDPMHSQMLSQFLRGLSGLKLREQGFLWRLSAGSKHPQPRVTFCLIPPQVMEELQAASVHSDERELLQLLSTPHLRVVTQSLPAHTACVPWDGGRGEHSAGRLRKEEF